VVEGGGRGAMSLLSMSLLWNFSLVADQVREVIAQAEADLRLEQAVYGLDAQDERAIQAMLGDGLARHCEVAREVHYPSAVEVAGRTARASDRKRCDLVLTPKGRVLRERLPEADLFSQSSGLTAADPGESLWLEVKIAYQYREGGVRHAGYGQQWRRAVVEDLKKMEAEPLIHEGALLLIVFNESADVLEKDLELFEDVLAQQEVLAGFRQVRSVEILDRIGHHLCTVALWPTVQR
jgi:hypothetical protein